MPIREFQCSDCGHTFEEIQSAYEEDAPACPHCETDTCVRLPSAPGGYRFASGSGSSSVTPRGSGSFKRGKK